MSNKKFNYGDLQDFVWDLIVSQKEFFDEEDIVKQIYNSGKEISNYNSAELKNLVIQKIAFLLGTDEIAYSQKENKFFVPV